MINANINGTMTAILATYEMMRDRGYGKIVCPIFRFICFYVAELLFSV